MHKYPYFIYPAICELRSNPDETRKRELKEFIAANVGDRNALTDLIGDIDEELKSFYPPFGGSRNSTDDTIDSFIAKYGGKNMPSPDTPLFPEETPVSSAELPPKEEKKEPTKPVPRVATGPKTDKNPLKEVQFMIKHRKYKEALEIMEGIYLNNPKKSVYFADQIRFIKKMMINEQKKTSK